MAKRVTRFPVYQALYMCSGMCAAGILGLVAIRANFGLEIAAGKTIPRSLLFLTAAFLVLGRRAHKRMKAPRQLTAALAEDPRAPVLFLREFSQEGQPFVRGLRSDLKPYLRDSRKWIPAWVLPLGAEETWVAFEDYMTAAVEESIGPLIALGCPQDYLQPIGAAREYVADENWQERFEQLAARAQAVLILPGTTDQLSWELNCLLRGGHAAKLFVIVGPYTFSSTSMWKMWRMFSLNDWNPANWRDFRARLGAAGYKTPLDCPPPVSVMAFH